MKAIIFVFIILFNSGSLGDFSRGHSYEVSQKRDLLEQRKAYQNAISLLKNLQFYSFSKEKEGLKEPVQGGYFVVAPATCRRCGKEDRMTENHSRKTIQGQKIAGVGIRRSRR